MQRAFTYGVLAKSAMFLLLLVRTKVTMAGPSVEFDFARAVECNDVTPTERLQQYPRQRLIEVTLQLSVRFHDVNNDDVDELMVEIDGTESGLRVHCFAPATQLASEVAYNIETTTTTNASRKLDATLGGALPVPFAAKVANLSPSISGGRSSGESTTEKLNRLPPKHAIVVSGTALEGRGVFFKLRRSSQTSLEGEHELAVTFIAPAGWRGGNMRVACSANGHKKFLWVTQPANFGSEGDRVRLYVTGRSVREVAKPVVAEKTPLPVAVQQASFLEMAAGQLKQLIAEGGEAKPQASAGTSGSTKTTSDKPMPK